MLNLYNLEKLRELDNEATAARRHRAERRAERPSLRASLARWTAWVPVARCWSRPAGQPAEAAISDPAQA